MRIADNYRPVLPLLRPYRRGLLWGMLFLVLTNLFTFMSPWILKIAVDDLQRALSPGRLFFYCACILAASLTQGFFRYALRRTLIGISRHVEYTLRNNLFRHLLGLPFPFFGTMRTGDIMSRATSDIEAVRMAIGPGVMHLANTTVTFIIAVTSMMLLHPGLTFFSFIPMPAVAFLMYFSARFYHQRFLAVQKQRAWLNTAAQENFSGIRVVKSYCQESFQLRRYAEGNREYMKLNLALARALGFFHPLVGMVAGTGTLIVLWAGGRLIIRDEITLGTLVAFMGFLSLLIWPTIALGWVVTLVQRGSAAMGRINEILETAPAPDDTGARLPDSSIGMALEARRLSFTYPGTSQPVLRDVSFSLAPGERVALIGRTGSGKSTLLNLLPRLWDPPGGTLFVDGVDVTRLGLSDLRRSIGFVPQETFLFTESLRNNIELREGESGQAVPGEMEQAASLARLDADIESFREGYDTVIGERGVTLSGGQKQRAAIARALLRRPRLLVLDDALSSVDSRTEESILDGLFPSERSCTVLFVSHRLSTVRRADRILVLDDGKMAESGTHEELMLVPDGLYRQIVERQILAEELEREEG